MDTEILARLQFAITVMFHYIYPPLSIGIGLFLVIVEGMYLKSEDPLLRQIARFWTRIFSLTFSMGVATGIVMEFEFGTNWATYSRFVGDVFGSALAAEGIFAFFLESGFLALLLFGWDRLGKKTHFFSTVMVALGAHFSAVWIVIANCWMQTPAGYKIVGEGLKARAEITDFWAMVFNPSTLSRLGHVILGCHLAAAFFVISISSYYLLKKLHRDFALISIKVALTITACVLPLQLITGDRSGKIIAQYQPLKLAALEGVFETKKGAPLHLFGLPNVEKETMEWGLKIPNLLSYMAKDDPEAEIKGLQEYPKRDWPKVVITFQTFRLMLLSFFLMVVLTFLTARALYRGNLETRSWLLKALVLSVFLPQIGNQMGWISAEMGRYPWIVQDLLRIEHALSESVTANQIFFSLILFTIVYIFLFALFLYLIDHKIKVGPYETDKETPYRHMRTYAEDAYPSTLTKESDRGTEPTPRNREQRSDHDTL